MGHHGSRARQGAGTIQQVDGKNGSADGASYRVDAYSYTNMSVTRFLTDPMSPHEVRLTLSLDNLCNSHAITDNAGPSAIGPNQIGRAHV